MPMTMDDTPMASRPRLLVVEDDPDDARALFRALRGSGRFEPVHARTGAEGLEAALAGTFAAFLVDYRLPDMSGIEVCRRLRALGATGPVLLVSSVQSDEVVERARAAGATDFLVKHLSYSDRIEETLVRHVVA
jgi:CheY-like chemotaxis protein